MVVKNYNIMGIAKAVLESAVCAVWRPSSARKTSASTRSRPGPQATRAASGIPEFDELLDKAKAKAPSRSLVSIDDVGIATAFLAHRPARLQLGQSLA
jgi:enoyl-[acyl-carrier protein] reductase I